MNNNPGGSSKRRKKTQRPTQNKYFRTERTFIVAESESESSTDQKDQDESRPTFDHSR